MVRAPGSRVRTEHALALALNSIYKLCSDEGMGGGALRGEVARAVDYLQVHAPPLPHLPDLISQKGLIKLFCKSQFPHKSVNLPFIITNIRFSLPGAARSDGEERGPRAWEAAAGAC